PLLVSARPAGFGHRARAESRVADEEALLARLGPLRRAVVARLLRGTQEWVRQRERTKSMAIALVAHGRALARAAAAHLVTAGSLRDANHGFFLAAEGVAPALGGPPPSLAAIERRKRRHEREAALPAPREIDRERPEKSAVANTEDALTGLSASPGSGMGRARVLIPGQPVELRPGEVLVAPVLDAGLGPFLASAGAAAAPVGGMPSPPPLRAPM